MTTLFGELKRRNVFRVAVAYLVAGWLIMQIADIVLDATLAPDWVMQVFLLFISIGFFISIIISWAYEITPEGLKLQAEVDRDESITGDTGRKLDLITIGLLVSVLIIVGVERMFFSNRVAADLAGETAEVAAEKSIAVLAFEDLSPEGDQAYFAEGLSEELLNVLAQVPGLKVAGRTSSFAFRGKDKDLREIGELLNVAHILEGSIRKSGNRIRVTAQLINAKDGFHLYSETYDRELSNIFELQDEIAESIATAMLSEIIGTDSVATATRTDTQTYSLYLLARQRIHSRDLSEMREAAAMLDRALEIDPIYAPALAQRALVTYLMSDNLGAYGDTPAADAVPAAMRLVDQAIALDGQLAEAHAVKGLLTASLNQNDEAIVELRLALQINQTMSDAATWLATSLFVTNQRQEAREILENVVKHDPTFGPAFNNLTLNYLRSSEFDKTDALVDRVVRIVGENDDIHDSRGMTLVMRGEMAEAARELRQSYEENPSATVTRSWYGYALQGVADYETLLEAGSPEQQMLALAALGRMDEAYRMLDSYDPENGFPPLTLDVIGYLFNKDQASREFIDYVQQKFGSIEALLRQYPFDLAWGVGYAAEIAYAALQIDDEKTFRELLVLMRDSLDEQAAEGADNWTARYDEARLAALSGDVDGALVAMQSALDGGYLLSGGFSSHIFSSLEAEPRYDDLVIVLANLVDEERAKLGMPPYEPILQNIETEKKPAWQP